MRTHALGSSIRGNSEEDQMCVPITLAKVQISTCAGCCWSTDHRRKKGLESKACVRFLAPRLISWETSGALPLSVSVSSSVNQSGILVSTLTGGYECKMKRC